MSNKIENESYNQHIPIACHYNHKTLLTKNGELLQIIYIDGFARDEATVQSKTNIRSIIRSSLYDIMKDKDDIAYHIHIMRDRTSIALHSLSSTASASYIDEKWNQKYDWNKQLMNKMFITVIHRGIRGKITFLKSMIFSLVCNIYERFLQKCCDELTKYVAKVADDLKEFGSYILSIQNKKDDDQTYISDLFSFYYKLIYMKKKEVLLDNVDASQILSNGLSIGEEFNVLTILDQEREKKNYIAIFTLKRGYNLPLEVSDSLLNINQHVVISETIYKADNQIGQKEMSVYSNIANASLQKNLYDNELKSDFCHQQICILVYAGDKEVLQAQLLNITKLFKKEGLVVTREDFYMPAAFWSILPGNTRYLARENFTSIREIGVFTSIHHRYIGSYNGSKWGEAICIFQSVSGNPYYFNFHHINDEECGHTIIFGPNDSYPQILLRLLIVQSLRNHPKVVILDHQNNYSDFVQSIQENQEKDEKILSFDIFDKENFNSQSDMLDALYQYVIKDDNDKESLQQIILKISELQPENRKSYLEQLLAEDSNIAIRNSLQRLYSFLNSADYNKFLANNNKSPLKEWYGVLNLKCNIAHADYLLVYSIMFFNNVVNFMDGMPTIIVIPNGDYILNIAMEKIRVFLQYLSDNNGILLLNFVDKGKFSSDSNLPSLTKLISAKIFVSDRFADKVYKKIFDLSNTELHRIKAYNKERKIFLLKQHDTSISLSFDLNDSNAEQLLKVGL